MITENNTKAEILEYYRQVKNEAKDAGRELPAALSGLNRSNNKGELLSAAQEIDKLLHPAAKASAAEKTAEAAKKKQAGEQLTMKLTGEPAEREKAGKSAESSVDAPAGKEIPETDPAGKKNRTSTALDLLKEDEALKFLNEDMIDKIRSLEEIKVLRQQEYESLMAVEQELDAFAAALNRKREEFLTQETKHKDALRDKAEQCRLQTEETERGIRQRVEEAEEALAAKKAEIDGRIKEREALRLKEKELFNYERSIKEREEDDLWQDLSAERERQLAALEAEISTMEKSLEEQESIIPVLSEKLDALPAQLAEAEAAGKEAREKELSEEHSHQTALARKDAEAAVAAMETQIKGLQADYESLLAEKEKIQQKLDKAYEESNKLYLQTVQSTGGIKILGGMDKNAM